MIGDGGLSPHGSLSVGRGYHLTDHQFSTVALIDSTANLLERLTYDAYGMARHHWAADLTGNGAVNDDDRAAMNAALNESIDDQDYNVDADITRTGRVTMTDAAHTGTSQYKAALPKGDLSAPGIDNVVGYCGYVFNPEVPTTGGGGGLYTVRFRHYDAELGRWLERDPLGYVDGMNLYGYIANAPVRHLDSLGFGKNDPHGREPGEQLKKQLEKLQERKRNAGSRREKKELERKIRNVQRKIDQLPKGEHHSQRAKGRGGRGAKASGFIGIIAIFWAVDDTMAAAPELEHLFHLLFITTDEHVALHLIDQIVGTLYDIYGARAIELREKLKEKWDQEQRDRSIRRAKEMLEKAKQRANTPTDDAPNERGRSQGTPLLMIIDEHEPGCMP